MENVKLPTGKACEPFEEARQPSREMTPRLERQLSKKQLTFADDIEDVVEKSSSQRSNYKEALSQPAVGLSHRQRLLWLQKRRTTGLWVQCDTCNQWRFLAKVLDRYELPKKWYCKMNPDPSYANCSIPEAPLNVREEEDLIHSEYSNGSLVWARLPGWPAWPAMIDDCPDTEQFYWLDGFSDIPTYYNVVFFDPKETTRAWISPENLKTYAATKNSLNPLTKTQMKYKKRLEAAIKQADDALKLDLTERLAKYSFLARYKGPILSPKKITNEDLLKYKKILKRKFDVDIPMEVIPETRQQISPRRNVILLGTPKKDNIGRRRTTASKPPVSKKSTDKTTAEDGNAAKNENTKETIQSAREDIAIKNNTEGTDSTNATLFKQPNSMAVQIGSTVETPGTEGYDNDTSKTYVPEGTTQSMELTSYPTDSMEFETQEIGGRITPNSDDFEFN